MKHLRALCLFLLLGLSPLFASSAEAPADQLVARLSVVEFFAIGGVGFGGEMSEGESIFRSLYARPDNLECFIKLYGRGNNAAKTYAMLAFRRLSSQRYQHIRRNYRDSVIPIPTMIGCMGGSSPLSQLLEDIELGRYDKAFDPSAHRATP